MNIQLFTNDDIRENVLKHVRGGSGLCYAPPSQSVKARIGHSYSSESRAKANGLRGMSHKTARNSSILFDIFQLLLNASPSDGSLMPSPTSHSHRSEAFAEDLVDELNYGETQ